jgi:hypothetical protein
MNVVNVLGPPPLHVVYCAQALCSTYVTQLNTDHKRKCLNTDLQDHLLPLSYSI